jgi:hypothetical protein
MLIEEKELIQLNTNTTSLSEKILPVIMCTWKREDGFLRVVQQLNNQNFKNFHLFVWNNNQEKSESFQKILSENANFSCSIIHSKENIGGFGRFFLAKHLLDRENRLDFCVFIDDDQTFEADSLDIFLKESSKKQISSQWAWKIKTLNYYGAANRINVSGGDSVDYCGTGGMVCDMDIFREDELFKCPEKYWFIEDLWLSFFANHYHGYELKKSSAKFKNGSDEHNLFDQIKHLKSPMLKDLVENYGWQITYNQ